MKLNLVLKRKLLNVLKALTPKPIIKLYKKNKFKDINFDKLKSIKRIRFIDKLDYETLSPYLNNKYECMLSSLLDSKSIYFINIDKIKHLPKLPKFYFIVNRNENLIHARYFKKALGILCQNNNSINLLNSFGYSKKVFYVPINGMGSNNDFGKCFAIKPNESIKFYIYRMMLYFDLIDYPEFINIAKSCLDLKGNKFCLSLPESITRVNSFIKENKYGFIMIPGIKKNIGWKGCSLSYKYISNCLLDTKITYATICEDDVGFLPNFEANYNFAINVLQTTNAFYVSGFTANFSNYLKIKNITKINSFNLITVNKLLSTVFNVYSRSALETMSKCNYKDEAIDGCLCESNNINVVLLYPFIVSHKNELDSTFSNNNNEFLYQHLINETHNNIKKIINQKLTK